MRPARIVLKALILAPTIACGLAAAAAQGGRSDPRLDVLTHFAPVYLVVGIVALTSAIFIRPGRTRLSLALFGAASAVGAMALIAPVLGLQQSPAVPAGAPGQIKLIQYNGGDMDGPPDKAAGWVAEQRPDILVLEEGSPALRHAIAARTGLHMACGMTCEVAIFSRARPVEVERPRRGYYGLGPTVTLAHFEDDHGRFTVAGVHYVWPTRVRIHEENSRRLLQILDSRPRERLILTGDFNSTPWSFARRWDEDALGLERRTWILFSWPARGLPGFPILPIDHVYAGADWRTVEVSRGPRLGGDHYPVVAVLAPSR